MSWDTLPTGTERILFVDDEEPIVELGQGVLRRLGYTVVTKRSGTEALAPLEAGPVPVRSCHYRPDDARDDGY